MSRDRRIVRLWATSILAGAATASPLMGHAYWAPGDGKSDGASAGMFSSEAEETDEVLFEADTVTRDFDDGPIVAEGDVRAFFGNRYLRTDKLIYDPSTNVVTAEGNVSITDEDMETYFAGRAVLSGDLRDGIIDNFSALLEENARLAADSAVQEQGARTRLRKAVYTACKVCKDNGDERTPTWRIKALRVTRDAERKVVRFHHAFFELKGVPLLYTPYLQGPDPSVERQSGFLTPRIGASSRLGFNFELPYYLALSNSQDATFFPKYTAEDGVLWQAEYRLRGKRGYHVLSGGVINFDNTNDQEDGVPGVRWHYFGRGHREFGDNWRLSYDVERVSDDDYLRQYNVERRGDLRQELNRGNTNQLRSSARAEWAKGGSALTVDTFLFQGLRAQDDAKTTPYILPLIDFQHRFRRKLAGGQVQAAANIASIYRTGGTDSQRFTGSFSWDRDIITRKGHRFRIFGEARADAYLFQDLDQGTESIPGVTGASTDFEARFAPTAGVEWSYPLARTLGSAQLFLEPRVQLIASPANIENDKIINEDSQSIEFDYAGLFDFNKATGYDAFEDGQRMNVGVAASAVWPNGIAVEGAVGQQFRIQSTDAFDFSSGLGEKRSDIVGSLNVRFGNRAGVENRFRVNKDSGSIDRAESLAFLNVGPVQGNVSYVRLFERANLTTLTAGSSAIDRREELTARGRVKLSKNWSAAGAWRLDLENNFTIRQDFTIGYSDECSTFGITYRRDRTRTTTLKPDNAVLITFTLRSLVQ